jgi:hypothetical protein
MPDIALDRKSMDIDGSFSATKVLIRVIITVAEITAGSFFKIDDKTLIIITYGAAERT